MERICSKRATKRARGFASLITMVAAAFAITACGSEYNGGLTIFPRKELASPEEVAEGGEELTIAVRYLAFTDSEGNAVVSEDSIRKAVDHMSDVWSKCNIGF